MAGWHHWLDGRESECTPGVGDGQGGLACCDSWGRKESDMTERLNWTELTSYYLITLKNNNETLSDMGFKTILKSLSNVIPKLWDTQFSKFKKILARYGIPDSVT